MATSEQNLSPEETEQTATGCGCADPTGVKADAADAMNPGAASGARAGGCSEMLAGFGAGGMTAAIDGCLQMFERLMGGRSGAATWDAPTTSAAAGAREKEV